jgi:hypothetical protein
MVVLLCFKNQHNNYTSKNTHKNSLSLQLGLKMATYRQQKINKNKSLKRVFYKSVCGCFELIKQ